jgi:drug/metabolite transporter (DMT)-like permease
VLGYGLAGDRRIGTREIGGSLALGYTNLVHVASSYESFRHLPAGQAMSILYTYPLWNLLFVAYFNNEKITGREYSLVGIAAIGSILLNMNPGTATPAVAGANGKVNPVWGVFMALLMALTESGMHTILRIMKWTDPAKAVWIVNTSASLWLGGAMAVQQLVFGVEQQAWTGTWWDQLLLTGFNSLSIFTGYWLRYYAVPRLSSSVYSMLSYAGLLASYLFGLAFLGEVPGWQSVLGALIIVGAGLALQIEQEPK